MLRFFVAKALYFISFRLKSSIKADNRELILDKVIPLIKNLIQQKYTFLECSSILWICIINIMQKKDTHIPSKLVTIYTHIISKQGLLPKWRIILLHEAIQAFIIRVWVNHSLCTSKLQIAAGSLFNQWLLVLNKNLVLT